MLNKKITWIGCLLMFGWLWNCVATEKDFRESPDKYWNYAELSKVPDFRDAPFPDSKYEGLRDILITGTEIKGKRPEFFAYVGYPSGPVPPGGFPGVVLVHGGGGTAYPQYTKLWIDRGYAVIAIDWGYRRPVLNQEELKETIQKEPLKNGGKSSYITNVANIVLTHSLLRSLENVNPDQTIFVGLSWGSWYGVMAAAVDPRFKGGILIYCGGLVRANTPFLNGRFHHAVKIPLYWVAGTNDLAVTPISLQNGFDECPKVENVSMVIRLPHSHVGFTFESCFRMAEYFLKDGVGLPKLGKSRIDGKTIRADILAKGKGINRAILCYTEDAAEKVSHKRLWKSVPAQFDDKNVWAELPDHVYQCFLSAYDQESKFNDLCGSSSIVELTSP